MITNQIYLETPSEYSSENSEEDTRDITSDAADQLKKLKRDKSLNKKDSIPDKPIRSIKTSKQFNIKLEKLVSNKLSTMNKYKQSQENNEKVSEPTAEEKESDSGSDEYCNPWDM